MTGAQYLVALVRFILIKIRSTDTRDISNLMGRAGFTLLTVDTDDVRVSYPSIWELTEDLRDMGESNAIVGRYGPSTFNSASYLLGIGVRF